MKTIDMKTFKATKENTPLKGCEKTVKMDVTLHLEDGEKVQIDNVENGIFSILVVDKRHAGFHAIKTNNVTLREKHLFAIGTLLNDLEPIADKITLAELFNLIMDCDEVTAPISSLKELFESIMEDVDSLSELLEGSKEFKCSECLVRDVCNLPKAVAYRKELEKSRLDDDK